MEVERAKTARSRDDAADDDDIFGLEDQHENKRQMLSGDADEQGSPTQLGGLQICASAEALALKLREAETKAGNTQTVTVEGSNS